MAELRFRGSIAGLGSGSGVRIVIGSWAESPFGPFTDVMLAEPDGTRRLLAPALDVAAFVAETYAFDDVELVPVDAWRDGDSARVTAGGLDVRFTRGRRTPLGRALRSVPAPVATSVWWSHVTDPLARALLRGVRTRGSTHGGRTETYSATDHHAVTELAGSWRGVDLGPLAPVTPDPAFGFGSTPERPSVTTLVTTVSTTGAGTVAGTVDDAARD